MLIFQSWMGRNELILYDELFPKEPLNILISAAHAKGEAIRSVYALRDQGKIAKVVMDSGTYTFTTKGLIRYSHGTSESYLSYMSDHHQFFDMVFNYDEIHDPSGFDTNYGHQLDLEYAGVPVIPVIQDIVGDKEIRRYLKDGCEIMALGSSQIKKPADLDIVFSKLAGTRTKMHLLGKTEYKFLIQKPLYSADSSSAIQYQKKGCLLFWNDHRQADENGDKTDIVNLEISSESKSKLPGIPKSEYQFCPEFNAYLDDNFSITLDRFTRGKTERNLMIKVINMRYYKILEQKVTDYHRGKGWIDADGEILPIK